MPIPESGCWIWCGSVSKHGYGTVTQGRKRSLHAHRAAYEDKFGKVDDGLVIRHTCDVKLCVNINHLIPGTQKQNIEDKVNRNRHAKGQSHGMSKLTEDQAKMIKMRLVSPKEAHQMFGISKAMARQIVSGQYWRHL
jgi:HNH endonuclease